MFVYPIETIHHFTLLTSGKGKREVLCKLEEKEIPGYVEKREEGTKWQSLETSSDNGYNKSDTASKDSRDPKGIIFLFAFLYIPWSYLFFTDYL